MWRILVESARRKKCVKHGGELDRIEVELSELPTRVEADELIALDGALAKVGEQDAQKAQFINTSLFRRPDDRASRGHFPARLSSFASWCACCAAFCAALAVAS